MNVRLLNRELGSNRHDELPRYLYGGQLRSLAPSSTRFKKTPSKEGSEEIEIINPNAPLPIAHYGGVNAVEVDKFDGRYLLSGGADSTISIWDLESTSNIVSPLGTITKADKGSHQF